MWLPEQLRPLCDCLQRAASSVNRWTAAAHCYRQATDRVQNNAFQWSNTLSVFNATSLVSSVSGVGSSGVNVKPFVKSPYDTECLHDSAFGIQESAFRTY